MTGKILRPSTPLHTGHDRRLDNLERANLSRQDSTRPMTSPPPVWQDYTAIWQAGFVDPVIGNGTLVSRFWMLGDLMVVRIRVLMGSTTTFGSGPWYFSLPTGFAIEGGADQVGSAWANDNSTTDQKIGVTLGTNSSDSFRVASDAGSWKDTIPFTWAVNDDLILGASFDVMTV